MTLALVYHGPFMSVTRRKRLRKLVEENMERDGRSGHSASGLSAQMAIEWCEARDKTWSLMHVPGGGYQVTVVDT